MKGRRESDLVYPILYKSFKFCAVLREIHACSLINCTATGVFSLRKRLEKKNRAGDQSDGYPERQRVTRGIFRGKRVDGTPGSRLIRHAACLPELDLGV